MFFIVSINISLKGFIDRTFDLTYVNEAAS